MHLIKNCRLLLASLVTALALSYSAVALAGETKTFELPAFTGVKLQVNADVKVVVGGEQRVTVAASEKMFEYLELSVKSDKLVITEEKNRRWRDDVQVEISVPALEFVRISGSGSFEIDGIAATSFTAQISGSGDIGVKGNADKLELTISGSGNMDMKGVEARDVSVGIRGSGDVKVHATESLKTSISGSGDVSYKGSPKLHTRISGSGDVRSL